ncbi:uncharacterized protein BX664DRAFT_262560 [Halteromyces radiatus]|uniref:uncharacterized protein n=1 Tax=Halteromyces radiatus TaxID=101107 RepID=UPI00221E6433|nr:uncharacterized protein BX664DRAFT_262560 [Halteromyces radiatus]KAI8089158.1 hypothetical protein BX664DRAFT_262560 [Halteromyces radiatus]
MSKTFSTSSRSTNPNSRSASMASSSGRSYNNVNYEAAARTYYCELRKYLLGFLAKEAAEGVHPQRASARQKLSRLSNLQFHELAMDVYDELVRRNLNDKFVPFLAVREEFHPKRNQARQKLATLPETRFQDLASDDTNRPPMPSIPPSSSMSSPTPKNPTAPPASQSTTIVPMKGTINVEPVSNKDSSDEEDDDLTQFSDSLDSLMADLGNMVHSRSQDSTNDNILSNNQLQDEYNRLDEQFRTLERDHNDQQQIVNDVKQETSKLMEELGKLSKENDKLRKEQDTSDAKNRQLTQEVEDWQTKYQKLRLELRNTTGISDHENDIPSQDIIKEHFLQPTRSGAISYDSVISYQAAIEDLLKRARSKNPSDVLTCMKTIVMTCKSITEDVENFETKNTMMSDKKTKLQTLKGPFSTGLANLVTAAKSHVNSMGISPVGLLDAAAGHLTVAMVDLVKLVGMTTSEQHRPQQSTPTPSISSSLRRQDSSSSNKVNGKMNDSMTPSQLAEYLKKETDRIVTSIQSLLAALRSSQKMDEVYGIITSIGDVVTLVLDMSRSTFMTGAGLRYRQKGDVILTDLQQCRDKLIQIRNRSFTQPETASSVAKRDLAKESYEIAKFIKELIGLCES